ncbi:unnamed protein product [Paramecium pentaurelia]|uniref:Uncharacterized protein n=1 Tax=Paramecium pentaurelia TaxID=43138 RepID=A0A8S1XPS5_9CILI|nr:unnamed protein product [Paramecium pentaurelia]
MSLTLPITNNQQYVSSGIRIGRPNENQQVQLEVSNDKVIFIANVKRDLDNMINIGPLFHQAILVVTSNTDTTSIDNNMKYHIVEYMKLDKGQSEVRCYQININIKNNPRYLEDLREFQDEQYNWKVMQNSWWDSKKKFQVNGNILVSHIKNLMTMNANYQGNYHLVNNNCQTVASVTTQQLFDLINRNQRGIWNLINRFVGGYIIQPIIDIVMRIPQLFIKLLKILKYVVKVIPGYLKDKIVRLFQQIY